MLRLRTYTGSTADDLVNRASGCYMARSRKKPVVIEATQWNQHGDHPAVEPTGPAEDMSGVSPDHGVIPTLEGRMVVSPGDWVITGVQGEHYPCKPDIFEATYEPA